MSGMFGPQTQGPTRINEARLNQSVMGYGVPVVMGCGKIQQSILWLDGFSWTQVNTSGGKGFGGGKGGNQYVYSADVIAGLCAGPVTGIGDVWSGQSWLRNTWANESYTITGGTPQYTPVNAAHMTADGGAGFVKTYSATLTDLAGGRTLSGSMLAALKKVAFVSGATLTTGTYSVNPANNQYHFSPTDAGLTVQMSYSYALSTIYKQEIVLIPSGLTVSVGGTLPFAADGGVVYATGTDEGQPVTHTVSGSAPATYTFTSGDVGQEVQITYSLDNSSALPAGTQTSVNFTLFEGYPGQSAWSLLEANYPGAALGYSGVALACYAPMDLGYGGQIQQNVFEVITPDGWGGGITDCSPVQCILQVLTNPMWGLGAGAVPFPLSAIDNGPGGTWGTPGAGQTIQDGTATAWFAANGFFISPVIDKQDTAAALLNRWLEAGQCAAFMSEGLFKLVPYGDTSTAGNGAVWVAPSEFACALDDTCFLTKGEGEDPVKISSSPWQDAYNTVQVQWNNRANQYSPEITPESDQAAINRYGSRIEDPQTWDFITTLPSATFAASMRVKRNVYTRNTYEFSLGHQYCFLEPMDVCPISTSSQWAAGLNNTNLAVVNLAVRLTKIVDNPDGTRDCTAEDYPFGANEPVIYNKGIAQGQAQPNQYSDPGNTTPVLFNATQRLVNNGDPEIWMGAAGANASWGGCNVFASEDGSTYLQIGTIDSPARLGTLGAAFGSGSDPDSTNSLVVNLVGNYSLESGTTADADNDNTLCYVDGELISYSACAITGAQQYTMGTYIRRGQLGSSIGSHASGSQFLRVDSSVFRYGVDPTWVGKTVYLKFQSFNLFGNSPQDLSTLTPVTFVVSNYAGGGAGVNPDSISPTSVVWPMCGVGVTGSGGALTSISPYGSGINRAGMLVSIPHVSMQLSFTGSLTPSTTYYVYFYLDTNLTMQTPNASSVPGALQSPEPGTSNPILFYVASPTGNLGMLDVGYNNAHAATAVANGLLAWYYAFTTNSSGNVSAPEMTPVSISL